MSNWDRAAERRRNVLEVLTDEWQSTNDIARAIGCASVPAVRYVLDGFARTSEVERTTPRHGRGVLWRRGNGQSARYRTALLAALDLAPERDYVTLELLITAAERNEYGKTEETNG